MVFDMKKIFFILFIFPLYIFAQGNLQFNRTIFRSFDATYTGSFVQGSIFNGNPIGPNTAPINLMDSIVIVVPPGKTFKLESAAAAFIQGSFNCGGTITYVQPNVLFSQGGSPVKVLLNGVMIYDYIPGTHGFSGPSSFPIWLSEGTYVFSCTHSFGHIGPCYINPNYNYIYLPGVLTGFISGIEFNVIP